MLKRIKKPFTLCVDYQPKKTLSISFTEDDKQMLVKTFEIKRRLSQFKIIKIINKVIKEHQDE